jgi:hypothetical protein
MNKWDLNNPFVYSNLQKALLGYYMREGCLLDTEVINILSPYFDFQSSACFARGAATLFPMPAGIIKTILNKEFIYLDTKKVDLILEDFGLDNRKNNSATKLGISLLGPKILDDTKSRNLVLNYFIENLAKAFINNG